MSYSREPNRMLPTWKPKDDVLKELYLHQKKILCSSGLNYTNIFLKNCFMCQYISLHYNLYIYIYIYTNIYIIIIVIVKVWTETAKLWHKYLISKIRLLRSSYLNVFFTTRSFKYTRQIYVQTFIAALNINFYANTYIYIYI